MSDLTPDLNVFKISRFRAPAGLRRGRPYALACASSLACAVAFPSPHYPPETTPEPGKSILSRGGFPHKSIAVQGTSHFAADPGTVARVGGVLLITR